MIQPISLILGISLINTPLTVSVSATTPETAPVVYARALDTSNDNYFLQVSSPQKTAFDIDQARKAEEERLRQEEAARQAEAQRQAATQREAQKKAAEKAVQRSQQYTAPPTNSNYAHGRVIYWANYYGLDVNRVVNIAYCESGMRPNAVGGGGLYLGLFQQHATYWPGRAAQAGIPGGNALNADHNARVSTYMMKTQGYHHWPSC
jgi:hypothetical protein